MESNNALKFRATASNQAPLQGCIKAVQEVAF